MKLELEILKDQGGPQILMLKEDNHLPWPFITVCIYSDDHIYICDHDGCVQQFPTDKKLEV